MTPKLQQTIKRELERLPKEGQDAIATLDWVTIAEEIGKAHFMDDAQITNLQTETLLVLIGAVYPEFYAVNIENHAPATKSDAEDIAKEAFEKIFTPLMKTLEEDIKKNLKNKNPNHEQNLDFILSGGDYGAFVSPNSPLEEYPTSVGGGGLNSSSPAKGRIEEGSVHPAPTHVGTPLNEGNKTPTLAEIQNNAKTNI